MDVIFLLLGAIVGDWLWTRHNPPWQPSPPMTDEQLREFTRVILESL